MTISKLINRSGYYIAKRLGLIHQAYNLKALCMPRSSGVAQLKNKYAGKRCFIIGNGPSLNKIDPSFLKNEFTFGSNRIYLAKEWLGFDPTFYVVEDILVMEQYGAEIAQIANSNKLYSKKWSHFIPSLNYTRLNIVYDYSGYRNFPRFGKDAAKNVWAGGTVSYDCMQLAYYLGFQEVYLVGFDHNYAIPDATKKGDIATKSNHADQNHFMPNYFAAGVKWHVPSRDLMEAAYIRAGEVFKADGRHIYNATNGGHLEVFPRIRFEDIQFTVPSR